MGSGYQCRHASLCHTPMGCSVLCADMDAFERCNTVLELLIEAGRFTLGYTPGTDSFTHGKLMKVQHGGLAGLNKAVRPGQVAAPVEDISELTARAIAIDEDGVELPWQAIVTEIRNWENRRRKRNR